MPTLIHRWVEAVQAGTNPTVICRVPAGWIVLGDTQFLRGYSLLLPNPVVTDLNALDMPRRAAFLRDMTVLGDALLEVTGTSRINYEILGNLEPALHVHVFPRYLTEPDAFLTGPPLRYDRTLRAALPFDATRDRELMHQIAAAVQRRL
jgi:diadenosine tetraphosphate (Ap4A) HIT family hydrolase